MKQTILCMSIFWFLVAVYYFANMQFTDIQQFLFGTNLAIALSFCSIFSLVGYLFIITIERETK